MVTTLCILFTRQADHSVLAPRVVTAGCLLSSVVLLRQKLRRPGTILYRDSPIHEGHTVESQVLATNISRLPLPTIEHSVL